MLPGTDETTLAIAAGDVDGDGDQDLLVGNSFGEPERLYRNDGNGSFTDVTANLPPYNGRSSAVALADLDGDGDLDALIANPAGQNRLYLNGGTGVFTDTTTNLPTDADVTAAWAVADVDGDGDLDVLSANFDTNRLYLNQGAAVFQYAAPGSFPDAATPTWGLALGDVDADGDPDVLVANGRAANLLYLNNGVGVFKDATSGRLPADFDYTAAVQLGDVDGDGDLDVLFGNVSAQDRMYRNDGTGVFRDATSSLPVDTDRTWTVHLADTDGDGDLDGVFGHSLGVRHYQNDGTGAFLDVSANLPPNRHETFTMALFDADGDGDRDVVSGSSGFPDHLYLNDGAGTFGEGAYRSEFGPDPAEAVGMADVDGDGDQDLLFRFGADRLALSLNAGNGEFQPAPAADLPSAPVAANAFAFGDVDGDGDQDVLLATPTSNRLYLNNGAGVFRDRSGRLPSNARKSESAALGDVDADGDLDALIVNTGRNSLWLNDGTGRFTDASGNLPPHAEFSSDVALGDVDGDGDPDVVIANLASRPNNLYLNNGSGVFSDASANLPQHPDRSYALDVGDVDGDGDLDVAVFNDDTRGRLYLNQGAGTFTDAPAAWPDEVIASFCGALGDLDRDGDLDAVLGIDGPQNRVFRNDGSGMFTDATDQIMPEESGTSRRMALGDVDGDGDLDAVFANATPPPWRAFHPSRLYTNFTRALTWRGTPRVGKPLTLDLQGPANGWFALFLSGGLASSATPYGLFRLDPQQLQFHAAGVFDTQGRASVTVAVPAGPQWVGQSVYWQAFQGAPSALTNLEITTFTGQ